MRSWFSWIWIVALQFRKIFGGQARALYSPEVDVLSTHRFKLQTIKPSQENKSGSLAQTWPLIRGFKGLVGLGGVTYGSADRALHSGPFPRTTLMQTPGDDRGAQD